MTNPTPEEATQVVEQRQQRVVLFYEQLTEAELAAGKLPKIEGGFIPVLDMMSVGAKLATVVNEIALDMAMNPEAACPEPDAEDIKQALADIEEQIAAGALPEEARHIDIALQLKYQVNTHNMMVVLAQLAAAHVVKQYRASSLVQVAKQMPPAPGSAISIARR